MLRWRLASSAVIISILLLAAWLDCTHHFGHPGIWLAPIGLVVTGLATGEVLGLLRAQKLNPSSWVVYTGTFIVVLTACAPVLWRDYPANSPLGKLDWPLIGLALGMGVAFVGEIQRYKDASAAVVNLAVSVFAITYIGLLMSFIIALRLFHDNHWGMAALLSMVVVVKLSDSGAYAVGRTIGKHKMAPRLSPRKTIEGAVGGIVTACLAAWLVFDYLLPSIVSAAVQPTPVWASLLYGLVLSIAAMLGDLAESLLKREAGYKDSSTWIPGLGGVLDIMDSVLAAAPAALLCYASGLVGP